MQPFIKKKLRLRCFVNFAKQNSKTPFLQNTFERLILQQYDWNLFARKPIRLQETKEIFFKENKLQEKRKYFSKGI